jgi:cell division septation protein DedD
MAQAENEKELILGNKQLISLFFLVVAMCGAFFAFGYMIGRNATKTATVTGSEAGAAQASGSAGGTTQGAAAETQPGDQGTPAIEAQAPVTETQPAQDTPAASAPLASTPPPPAAAVSAPAAGRSPAPVSVAQIDSGGTYLQVTALRKADADNLVKTLREQNLPALTAESSKADLIRVLVGPYHQTAQVAEAKAKLKTLGFANAFVQK